MESRRGTNRDSVSAVVGLSSSSLRLEMKRCLCCIVHFVGLVLLKRDAVVLESGSIDIDVADKRCGAAMPRDVVKEKLPSFVHSLVNNFILESNHLV